MGFWRRRAALAVLWMAVDVAGAQQRIPAVHGTTLAGGEVVLPEALRGRVGVLVVGFSQGSREAVTAWGRRLAGDYYDSQGVAYYEMPVLAAVPRLIRGMVIGRIRSSVADRARPHFVPVTDNEEAWRALVQYKEPDDAYVLVVDGQGMVRWQTHGAMSEAQYGAMKAQVEALRAGR